MPMCWHVGRFLAPFLISILTEMRKTKIGKNFYIGYGIGLCHGDQNNF